MLSNIFTRNLGKRKKRKLKKSESEKKKRGHCGQAGGQGCCTEGPPQATEAASQEPAETQLPAGTRAGADKVAALRGRSWGSWWAVK